MTAITLARPGIAGKFPSLKKYLKDYVLGPQDWETEDLADLKRYAAEGPFGYTGPDGTEWKYSLADAEGALLCVGGALRWHGIQSSLTQGESLDHCWLKSAAYGYWGLRAEHRFDKFRLREFQAGSRPQYLPMMRFRSAVSSLAQVFLLDWRECALSLNRSILDALQNGGYFDADETSHPRAQFFALGLMSAQLGLELKPTAAFAHDEPIYEFLRQNWKVAEPSHLTEALLAALDRHTHQSVRAKRNGPATDFLFDEDWYFPYEVLLVLKLRELYGLANPRAVELTHPLIATPLGRLPAPTPVYSDDVLDGVIRRMRQEFPDL